MLAIGRRYFDFCAVRANAAVIRIADELARASIADPSLAHRQILVAVVTLDGVDRAVIRLIDARRLEQLDVDDPRRDLALACDVVLAA